MSFISILKKIDGIALGVEHAASPFLKFIPGPVGTIATEVDDLINRLQGAVVKAEVAFPAPGSGPQKALAVADDFAAALTDDIVAPILAARGEQLDWDKALLKETTDAFAAAYTSAAKLKASIHIVPLVKPGAPPISASKVG